jgi:hypothetical protein
MRSRIQKHLPTLHRKLRAGNDPRHLANVRQLPCLTCPEGAWSSYETQAHHLMRTGERGLSLKSPDKWAVPLCWACHGPSPYDNVTDTGDEDAWFAARGVDGRAIAQALWAHRGDLAAMQRVIFVARQRAALNLRERRQEKDGWDEEKQTAVEGMAEGGKE